MDRDILTGAICPKKNMGLLGNKYDKRIINESDKTHSAQETFWSNNNIIFIWKLEEKKIEDKKLRLDAW